MIIETLIEKVKEIYDAGVQVISDFWSWYEDQDENTQNLVALIFALLLLVMWQSAVR